MPLDFGKECPYNIYLSGERTEIHLGDGSLLYTLQLLRAPHRGTGVSTKLLKDKAGNTRYIITQVRNKADVYEAPRYYISAVRGTGGAEGEGGSGPAAANALPTEYGSVGRVFQEGYEVCVSFRCRDSERERKRLAAVSGVNVAGEAGVVVGEPDAGEELDKTRTRESVFEDDDDDDEEEEAAGQQPQHEGHQQALAPVPQEPKPVEHVEGGLPTHHPTHAHTPGEAPTSKIMKFFTSLFPGGGAAASPADHHHKRPTRFIGLVYDGRGKWIYLASRTPSALAAASAHATDPTHTYPSPPTDIVVAHKDADDSQKGFLGLRRVAMEKGNEWLRDMVTATWVTVLWEEERWGRLPGQLRQKGLEYLGGIVAE